MRGFFALRLGAWLFVVASLASLWATPDLSASLPAVLQLLAGAALVLILAGWMEKKRPAGISTTSRLLDACLLLGFGVLALTLLGTRWPEYKLSFLSGLYGALPSLRSLPLGILSREMSPNQAGGILATFVAFGLAPAFTRSRVSGALLRRQRIAARALVGAGTVVVFMTGSRAALAGIAAALLLVTVAAGRRWLWVPGIAAGTLALASGVDRSVPGHLLGLLIRDETIGTKLVARLDIWSSALNGIQDHAFTGIGLGVLNEVLPIRYPYESVGLTYTVTQAHNIFLDTALTLGLLGLGALVCLLLGMGLSVAQSSGRDANQKLMAKGVMAATVVFVVFGMTDSLSLSTPASVVLWLWAIILIIVSPSTGEV
ncbi:MAG: O-antigen ligase family protein [Thermoleophilia bacterium]|nr:O-antigen ligase family protein [Thermoleophilia bacterium]